MVLKSVEPADFYQQLALLVEARLPLPESLRQLGENLRSRRFRAVLDEVSRATAAGEPLHVALARHPQHFEAFHVQLIATGEQSGTLPEVLFEVARFARANQQLLSRTREILAYPVLTVGFAVTVFLLLLRYVTPQFAVIYQEFLAGEALPLAARPAFALSAAAVALGDAPYYALGALALVLAWLFSGQFLADRALYRLLNAFPYTRRVLYEADWARVALLLHVYLNRRVPMVEALRQTAELAEGHARRLTLRRWAAAVAAGGSLKAVVAAADSGADGLFALALRHSPEDQLAAELGRLGDLYRERADAARAAAIAFWQVLAVTVMVLTAFFVLFSLFAPLVKLVERMSA